MTRNSNLSSNSGKVKKQIPNLITLANLLCGVLASFFAVKGDIQLAALFICLGIFFDFFDGMAARLLDVASPLGKELDSLADVVTSGVAPSFILLQILWDNPIGHWVAYLSLLMPLFAAYRLAKFNLDTRQSHSFLGLPVPANALIWVGPATMPLCAIDQPNTAGTIIWLVIMMIGNILMVGEVPMFSLKFNFKDLSWRTNSIQYIFLIGCAVLIALSREPSVISFIIFWYIFLSLITCKRHHAE